MSSNNKRNAAMAYANKTERKKEKKPCQRSNVNCTGEKSKYSFNLTNSTLHYAVITMAQIVFACT